MRDHAKLVRAATSDNGGINGIEQDGHEEQDEHEEQDHAVSCRI